MRRLFLIFLLLLAACSVTPVPSSPVAASAPEADVSDLELKTVALVDPAGTSVRAYCSGTWVSKSVILTANHCLQGAVVGDGVFYAIREDVYGPGEFEEHGVIIPRNALVSSLDVEHDLATLIGVSPPDHLVAQLATEPVRAGQRSFTMGHPLGKMWSYSSGDVASVRMENSVLGPRFLFVQTTAPISPGNSGGALFNSSGEVIGVCHGSWTRGQNMNLFIHFKYAEILLRRQ